MDSSLHAGSLATSDRLHHRTASRTALHLSGVAKVLSLRGILTDLGVALCPFTPEITVAGTPEDGKGSEIVSCVNLLHRGSHPYTGKHWQAAGGSNAANIWASSTCTHYRWDRSTSIRTRRTRRTLSDYRPTLQFEHQMCVDF